MEDKLIPENPAKGMKKRFLASSKEKRESHAMEPEEAKLFLEMAAGEYYALFAIALHAGLRQGEILALRGSDIDFAKGQIRVERRWYRGTFDTPKGKRPRYVDMSTELKAVLEYLKIRRKD